MNSRFRNFAWLSCAWFATALSTALAENPAGTDQSIPERAPIRFERHNDAVEHLRPTPPGRFQRYVVGQGLVEGGAAGGTGVEIYRNVDSELWFPPGAGVLMADDLQVACLSSTNLTYIELFVTGGGNGTGPGFTVDFELWNGCPSDTVTEPAPTPIPGTQGTATLPNDGNFSVVLDLAGSPVLIEPIVWLAAIFSTNEAGWVLGSDVEIGDSMDVMDTNFFACGTSFGGCPPNPCAKCDVRLFGEPETCEDMSFLAYRAHNSANVFFPLNPVSNDWFADDVVPITAPQLCNVSRYQAGLLSTGGAFTMNLEIFSHDVDSGTPFGPVMGTFCSYQGQGNGVLEIASCDVLPAREVDSEQLWITYRVPFGSPQAGPILTADFADIGFSEDCFAIYGDPTPDEWSGCVWFFGGCPLATEGNPCAIFYASVYCTGTEPMGACCDLLAPGSENCAENVPFSQCNGRRSVGGTCDSFDPACSTAVCCKQDGSCDNLTATECLAVDGFWRPTDFCGVDGFMCPHGGCIGASGGCFEADFERMGCSNINCCTTVCAIDAFCCEVGWDDNCVGLAKANCAVSLHPNNDCDSAGVLTEGARYVSNFTATPDGPPLSAACDGVPVVEDIWFEYRPTESGMATLDLCGDSAIDSRIAVYNTCDCPVSTSQSIACNDDGCGVPQGPSRLEFMATAGNCYKIQLGSAPGPNSHGFSAVTLTLAGNPPDDCPAGLVTFTDPVSGTVDARQPHLINNAMQRQGIQTLRVTAPAGAATTCWSLCETAGSPANSIQTVSEGPAGSYTITLARPITAGAVTRVAYSPNVGSPTVGMFIFHPGNVNADGLAAPTDILRVIDCLNGINPGMNCPFGVYSSDADRSGVGGPSDILRVIDLLNGADAFDVWNGTPLPSAMCTP